MPPEALISPSPVGKIQPFLGVFYKPDRRLAIIRYQIEHASCRPQSPRNGRAKSWKPKERVFFSKKKKQQDFYSCACGNSPAYSWGSSLDRGKGEKIKSLASFLQKRRPFFILA